MSKSFIPDESGELVAASSEPIFDAGNSLPPGDYGFAFVKMFLTLIALIILFGVTIWFIRRLIRSRLERGSGEQMIEVLEKKMISPKTMLYVIEVEGKRILLAESHLEVRPISDIGEQNLNRIDIDASPVV